MEVAVLWWQHCYGSSSIREVIVVRTSLYFRGSSTKSGITIVEVALLWSRSIK